MTDNHRPLRKIALAAGAAAAVFLLSIERVSPQVPGVPPRVPLELRDRVDSGERVRFFVVVTVPGHVPEGRLASALARLGQRQRLNAVQGRLLGRLGPSAVRVVHRYSTLPYLAVEVNAGA